MPIINTLTKYLLPTIWTTLILAIFTGLLFPMLVYLLAHLIFSYQAEGSLLQNKEGTIIGSRLIGQNFKQPQYFHPRPSAAGGGGYDAIASGGTNLGPTSKKLIENIQQLAQKYRQENNLSANTKIPIDAVTRSASGLDPHISVPNAILQLPRIASSRHMTPQAVQRLIESHTTHRQLGFLGEPGINVLETNLALDEQTTLHLNSAKDIYGQQ
jgi:potassium-transporting ATPase KdpC subunit